jgi:hypothetical protein
MQTDGNLVIYSGSTPHFNTASSGTAADHVIMQDDGNLVVYSADRGQYFWNAQVSFSDVTCPAPTTTTTTATTEAYTLPATTTHGEKNSLGGINYFIKLKKLLLDLKNFMSLIKNFINSINAL